MIDLLFSIVDAISLHPAMLLSGLQLALIVAVLIAVMPHRLRVAIAVAVALLLVVALLWRLS